uniref:Uncharacterized protein n=1 Tax=Corethron hystrix TaxID=216773 RepID=A0A7S1FLE7_9STRA|mmetsp:Transcript_13700/g.30257  ORF Transcript_13700/g.30257 Transcript_13700/m.30257 type:complete len:577 (+) Transcript_13700:252-1982(+)
MPFANLLPVLLLTSVRGSNYGWNIVNDARTTNKDVTPSLGRGYSLSAGSFHSVCLVVDEVTDSTADFDFIITELQRSGGLERSLSQDLSGFGAARVDRLIKGNVEAKLKTEGFAHHIIATMKSDRYYVSINDGETEIIPQIATSLGRGNAINFFQSCGPNYIRSIRRSTEIIAVFKYTGTDVTANLKLTDLTKPAVKPKFHVNTVDITITIMAFGLALGPILPGEDPLDTDLSLVASDMDGYQEVMDTAFLAMNDPNAGLISSIEIVPWIANAAFHNALRLETTLSRNSLMCKSVADGGTASCLDSTSELPDSQEYTCGYNNGIEAFDNTNCVVTGTEDAAHKDLRKFNMIANAEFISQIDQILRQFVITLQKHMACLNALIRMPRPQSNNMRLFNRREERYLGVDMPEMTVKILLYRLWGGDNIGDVPDSDFLASNPAPGKNDTQYMFARSQDRITSYISGFYAPCLSKLSEERYNVPTGNMQLNHWTNINECAQLMCTRSDTTWQGASCVENSGSDSQKDFIYLEYRLDEYCPPQIDERNFVLRQVTAKIATGAGEATSLAEYVGQKHILSKFG